ncbi:MAG TPA: DinB family protein [Thermoanaerobaculia bacterium]|nr:DinB family protein [Thermoanaerobaculia bacterium]
MKRAYVCGMALALLALPGAAVAHDHGEKPATAAGAAAGGAEVRAEILRQLGDAEEKLMALAEAMPAEKYGWRPAEGVRTVGEVFLHVAGGNYFLPTFWGVKPPEGIDMRAIEKDGADKAKVIAGLKRSFDHARKAIADVPEAEMGKAIKIFGRDGSVREAFMIDATHAHEHLGQAIAYARMNGIAPPWSRGE